MVWRGRTTSTDRLFASLVYLLPLAEAYLMARPLVQGLVGAFAPGLRVLLLPLEVLAGIYGTVVSIAPLGLGGFLIFILLILTVVRNESICHFVRFNTMQSIIVGIALSLFTVLWSLISEVLPTLGLLTLLIIGGLFLATLVMCVYAIVQSVQGKYPEIPTISDAAYVQVP